MFQIVESCDHPTPRPTSLRSLLASLVAHVLLALVLWSVAYNAVKRQSISLIASTSASGGEVTMELVTKAMPTMPIPSPGSASSVHSKVAVETVVSKSLESESLSDSIRENFEPASVEFFGTRAFGNRFVYVLDISYSMKARNGERFDRACDELLRSISSLREGQSYYVFLFCWNTEKMFYDPVIKYANVEPGHEKKLRRWIYLVSLGAGTDPRRALALAHGMKPDAVFLLSDGHFNKPSSAKTDVGWIDQSGKEFEADVHEGVERVFRQIPIHAIAFENPFTLSAMQQIASATGGSCRYVRTRSHKPLDAERFLTALRHIESKHRHDRRPKAEYVTRLSYAREFIRDGELAYAEYLIRPLRRARESMISNPVLLAQVIEILDRELGSTQLEDFEPPPELADILGRNT